MGGKSSAPPAPDYKGAAEAEAAGNIDYARATTRANRVNQFTPFGSLTYTQPSRTFDQAGYDSAMAAYNAAPKSPTFAPAPMLGYSGAGNGVSDNDFTPFQMQPQVSQPFTPPVMPNKNDFWSGDPDAWESHVTFSPEMQNLFDLNVKSQQDLAGLQSGAVDRVSKAVNAPMSSAYDPSKASNNAYELIMSRMADDIRRDQDSLNTRLSNQGLSAGGEAYEAEQMLQGKKLNDARIAAAIQSMDLGARQQQQSFNQEQYLRQLPLNELNAIRSGSQVSMPTFQNAPQQAQTMGPNYMGAAQNSYQGAMNAFNVDQANDANQQQSAMQIASMLAMVMFSDIRIKRFIRKVGELAGLGLYRYFNLLSNSWETGFLAQEVLQVKPRAVIRHPNGLLMVNYRLALED